MKYLVIDTCIVLHILRGKEFGKKCLAEINTFDENVSIIISAVTKAELESLKIQQNWGDPRCKKLNNFLENVTYVDISNTDNLLIESYSRIDAFSKRKTADTNGNLLNNSAKTMGKNDLWIAATAHTLNTPLMTADNDFDHLNNTFITIVKTG